MTSSARDRELGMNRAITRRDFLNGAAIAVGAMAAGCAAGRRAGRREESRGARPDCAAITPAPSR